jgi:beta-galactosidase
MKIKFHSFFNSFVSLAILSTIFVAASAQPRTTELFTKAWHFNLGDVRDGKNPSLDDSQWRLLDLPHDWSIEGKFRKDNPAGIGGGALPGGIGWYRKTFTVPESNKNKLTFIQFDGVYRNSKVWINGHFLSIRPYGYSSFQYEITPFLKYGKDKNVLAVKIDNSQQPNSRWYSGSGIYRNVWLITTENVFVNHWGTFVTTSEVSDDSAKVSVKTQIRNAFPQDEPIILKTVLLDKKGREVAAAKSNAIIPNESIYEIDQELIVKNPQLWSVDIPNLYKAVSIVEHRNKVSDEYTTTFGIRTFRFDVDKGFFLNGKNMKILGVCNHHDLGCLGAAINVRALERQLEMLKSMGCNGIRTSHNPPAPELLDLCDRMGFIIMDEAFDMWAKEKTKYDYHLDYPEWHKRDLEDMVLRDRNHPSVFIWSIGNEVSEQWDKKDPSGVAITKELTAIVKDLDTTRPVTSNMNEWSPENPLKKSGALDLIGFSYDQKEYHLFPTQYPGKKMIGSETTSALETRGHYDMPSDSIRRWPMRWDSVFTKGNSDNSVSAYDNVSAPWGGTHEEVWKEIKKYDFMSGMFIWTGFDYLGEPTPYEWPSRSSYFGIIDLAGFPKDVYYMYQSEWTKKPVLHIFPYWNWKNGQTIDVWAYTNCDSVELFLNNKSMGVKKKSGDKLHLMWRLIYEPGTVKAKGWRDKDVLSAELKTAGTSAKVILEPDRKVITADGRDLSFVTVKLVDDKGTLVPNADNLVHFKISGEGKIVGVDNGSETDLDPFKADYRKAFNGLALVVIQSTDKVGKIRLEATSDGLKGYGVSIETIRNTSRSAK